MTLHHRNEAARSAVLRRIIIYGILFFVVCIAQCSFFTRLSFLSVAPNIIMGAVTAIALLDSQKSALICGICAGFMIDALGSSGLSLSPIALFFVAIVSSEIAKKMLPNFLSWVIILIPAALVRSLFTLMSIFFSIGKFDIISVIRSILLPEFLITLIISLPLFFIVKLCVRLADAKSRFKI